MSSRRGDDQLSVQIGKYSSANRPTGDAKLSELLSSAFSLHSFFISSDKMREIVHIQVGQCGNQIGAKVNFYSLYCLSIGVWNYVLKLAESMDGNADL